MNKKVSVDIGAGCTSFGKSFKRLNNIGIQLVGDTDWKRIFGLFGEDTNTPEQIIARGRNCVYKILLNYYTTLPFSDSSIDIVTINSPYPQYSLGKIFAQEVERILKPHGLFLYAHSTDIGFNFVQESQMKLLGEGGIDDPYSIIELPRGILYKPSPTIRDNVRWRKVISQNPHISGGPRYVYDRIPLRPNWKMWEKL